MNIESEKKLAAGLSIVSNSTIIILKLIAGFVSGSISVISEAIHSMSDLLASFLTFFSVLKSAKPADSDHPYGHGKYEDMSGFLEGILIILAAVYIIYEAVQKLYLNKSPEIETLPGIIVMIAAVIANFLVSKYLFHVAKKSDSLSLLADAEHLNTDILSSAGVLAGLVLIKITGLHILDSVIAILVAAFIMRTGFFITKKALNNLLDGSLPEENIETIENVLDEFVKLKKIAGYKNLKSRRAGPKKNIEITLFFSNDMKIYDCHKICDEIEDAIDSKLGGNTVVFIHAEPEAYCHRCSKKSYHRAV